MGNKRIIVWSPWHTGEQAFDLKDALNITMDMLKDLAERGIPKQRLQGEIMIREETLSGRYTGRDIIVARINIKRAIRNM